jgi:hypothetical protein
MATVRSDNGAAAHDASAAQHGSSVARSALLPFEWDVPGAQSACAELAVRAPSEVAAHVNAVPTTTKCIMASNVNTPNVRRTVMPENITSCAA